MEEWGRHYRLGLIWQDYQHKALIDRMCELEKAIKEGAEKNEFYSMISFLGNYMDDHFAMEEAYMDKYDYPQIETHIRDHRKFTSEFNRFKSGSIYQESTTASELLDLLSRWVNYHMVSIDKTLAGFLIKNGIEKPKVI